MEGKSPLDLPPLGETIDADAVLNLFDRSDSADVAVEFTYCGYDVTVHSDRHVGVAESGVDSADTEEADHPDTAVEKSNEE